MIAAPEPNLATWRSGNSKRHAQAGSPPPLRYPGARRGARAWSSGRTAQSNRTAAFSERSGPGRGAGGCQHRRTAYGFEATADGRLLICDSLALSPLLRLWSMSCAPRPLPVWGEQGIFA